MRLFVLFSVLGFFLLAPAFSHAGLEFPNLGEPLIILVEPKTVPPNSAVSLTLESFLLDLDRSSTAWFKNGTAIEGAANKTSIKTAVGALGTETTISVVVEDARGMRAEGEVVLRPVELELLWESDSYTPPLYRGRAIGSPGSNIVAYAETRFVTKSGARVPPSDTIYEWVWNGEPITALSGRGKPLFTIPVIGLYGDDIISVNAISADGLFRASMTVRVPSIEPALVLHPYQPLLGIDYRRALGRNAALPGPEATFAAIPYFSRSSGPRDRGITYHWLIDSHEAPLDSVSPFLLTLATSATNPGLTTIEILLENSYNILQEVRRSWEVRLNSATAGASLTPFLFPKTSP